MTALIALLARHRSWLLLLAVAAIGAALYAWGAEARADRARLLAWGDKMCAAAGAELMPAKGKRGAECFTAVQALARFKAEAAEATAEALATAERSRANSAAADARVARAAADAARTATAQMEAANAQVTDDRVGRDWIAALNRTAGLRPR
ncbi:hypothetical protein [Sphingomonas jatrophae]|uniref:hypothetical protein n=1 Tax=Sphingomonas jatrophae TaxID=1166337 RepID=UPI000B8976BF|nr:hypothetical protein [Sphingomonas jatrophae]